MIRKMIAAVATVAMAVAGANQADAQKSADTSDIAYQIMVQRATQAAIWAMPAAAMIDFEKATKQDLGGDVNDVIYVSKPFASRHALSALPSA